MKIIISNLKMSGKYNMVKLLKPGPVSKLCLKYNVHNICHHSIVGVFGKLPYGRTEQKV